MLRLFFVVCCALFLASCEERGEPVDETTLDRFATKERTVLWTGFGFSGEATFKLDGSATLSVDGLGDDKGQWWREGKAICTKWQVALRAEKRCGRIGKLSGRRYEIRDDALNARIGSFQFKIP